mmetsp:Transcript_55695/g.129875  ORF Transcript_55695/g.129875 Transcript_55695/m.129875 type:complete len:228 (+) Transcript_55695:1711-2394(+)
MRLGRKSLGAALWVLATCSPVLPASTISAMFWGTPSSACAKGVFLEPTQPTGRGTVAALKGIPPAEYDKVGRPESFIRASRRASRACPGRAVRLRPSDSSKCLRAVVVWLWASPLARADFAKVDHAFSSLSTHSAASCRMVRCVIRASCSGSGCVLADGTAGRDGLSVIPAVKRSKSESLEVLLGAVAAETLVCLWDLRRTASAFLPSVTANGWSSPRQRFATWKPW